MSDEKTLVQVFEEALAHSQILQPGNAGSLWLIEMPGDLSEVVVNSLWDKLEYVSNHAINIVFVNFPVKSQVIDPPEGSMVLFSHPPGAEQEDIDSIKIIAESYQKALEDQGRKVAVDVIPQLPQVLVPQGHA